MTKRKISINRKSKDWKNKYPMVEIHWVDIVSDSSWQSLKQLKELQLPVCVTKGHLFSQDKGITRVFANRPPRQRATFFYSGSLVRGSGISANEQPTFVVSPNDLTWDAAKEILWP
jgi:hypothetical protein